MRLGPTLVGGVIGAAVGMGLHLIVEMTTGAEAPWFAIIIGLMTGLGVHQANKSLAGNVSYLRGAVTAAIALGAIVGSTPLISKVVTRRGAAATSAKAAAAKADADEKTDEGTGDGSAATTIEPEVDERAMAADGSIGAARGMAPWRVPVRHMAVGTFIAYEFGRGTARTRKAGQRTCRTCGDDGSDQRARHTRALPV
jgi:hypothetical protein